MSAAALLTQWARLFIDSLIRSGVRDVVISPGSRSTPFSWAALARRELTCHVLIDERSAAYFALGSAAASGLPTVLICTSGTAAANYTPAVVEAAQTGTPLVLLTADRPFELQRSGANQTIDQVKLYGTLVRGYFELGTPSAELAALSGLQRLGAQAVALSRFPERGPVHVNARARKPLEPAPASEAPELARQVDALVARGPAELFLPEPVADERGIAALAESCRGARRGLIACGPLSPSGTRPGAALAALAEVTGFPVWAEATSQARFDVAVEPELDALAGLLGSAPFQRRFTPDFVLQVGAPPTAASWERWLERQPALERQLIVPLPWPDPSATATRLVVGDPAQVLARLTDALRGDAGSQSVLAERTAFRRQLQDDVRDYWAAVDELLADGALSEASAVRSVVEALPAGGVLALGNSLPVREVDWYAPARPAGLTVVHQRGASGIDGVLSSACGAADKLARPAALVIGDVSLLHDLGGLLAARRVRSPLAIVALNNDGGRIFEHLPLFEQPGIDAEKLAAWTTPHGLSLAEAGALYGLAAERVTSLRELRSALAAALARPGASLIEAVVPPGGARADLARLRTLLDARLAVRGAR